MNSIQMQELKKYIKIKKEKIEEENRKKIIKRIFRKT